MQQWPDSVFSGWRVANVGGNSNNGTQVGAFTLNVNNDSSNANDNIGARTANALRLLATINCHTEQATPLGEIVALRKGLVACSNTPQC